MVFQPEAYKAIDGGFADCRGGGACIRRGGFIEVTTAARNSHAEINTVMLFENELAANAYEGSFIKVFEFNAVLVSPRRFFDFFFKSDIFDIEGVLEPEEK